MSKKYRVGDIFIWPREKQGKGDGFYILNKEVRPLVFIFKNMKTGFEHYDLEYSTKALNDLLNWNVKHISVKKNHKLIRLFYL
jgi:hypothetical protein